MNIEFLNKDFSCIKVNNYNEINLNNEFTFLSTTDNEKSVILETKYLPKDYLEKEDDFISFRLIGKFDFSLIGIASKITTILKDNSISVLVVSTFDTDYFFINKNNKEKAINGLLNNGYIIK